MGTRAYLLGLAAGATLALSGTSASASGPNEDYRPFSWSGFYIGANAGWMFNGDTHGEFFNAPGFHWDASGQDGAMLGIQAGVQRQFGNIVAGVEVSWSSHLGGNDFGSTTAGGAGAACGFVAGVQSCQARINDILQVGGRLGWAVDRWMLYGTGGFARAEIESRGVVNATGLGFSSANNTHNGWYAGGGVEFALTNHVTFGVEYVHYEFDSENHNSVTAADRRNFDADADVVRARLNLKFGTP